MKNLLFCITCLLGGLSLNAQDYAPEWGPVYEKEGGQFARYQFWGLRGDHYYLLMRPGKKDNLLKYDKNHKLVSAQEQKFEANGKKIDLKGFAQTTSGDFGIFNFFDKKRQVWKVFSSRFLEGEFGPMKEVFSHPFIGLYDFRFFRNTEPGDKESPELVVSADKSKVVFANLVKSTNKKTQDEIALSVFDENMNTLWSEVLPFEFPGERISIEKVKVNKEGSVFLLAAVKQKDREGKPKYAPEYDYRVYRIYKEEIKSYEVELTDGLAPTDIGLFLSQDNDNGFIVAGFYTKTEVKSKLLGVFCGSGNQEGFQTIKTHPFEDSFLEGIASEKAIEKDQGLSWDFDINQFIQFTDGTLGFLAEYFSVNQTTYTNSKGEIRTTYYYRSNSIIIPRFTSSGDLVDMQKIEKYFMSGDSRNTSYSYALKDHKIYLLFNNFKDAEERTDKKGKKGKARWRYTDLVVFNIETGAVEFNETLFNNKEIELEFTPYLSSFDENLLLIGSRGGKKYSFGTIELK